MNPFFEASSPSVGGRAQGPARASVARVAAAVLFAAALFGSAAVSADPVGAASLQTGTSDVAPAAGVAQPDYRALPPARLADTRAGQPTVDGQASGSGRVTPTKPLVLTIGGRAGVPTSGVAAVALNVTVTGSIGQGFLTVHPNGEPRPNASNVNFTRGKTVANAVTAKLGTGNRVVVYVSSNAHVIVDLAGYWTAGGVVATSPTRLADTRSGGATVDGRFAGTGAVTPGSPLQLEVTGRAGSGVPASGVTAVALNVTVTGPADEGYLTVYPAGSARPGASNLNFVRNQTVANAVVAKVGTGGRVTIFNSNKTAHVVVDVAGYFTSSSQYVSLNPARFADTRPTGNTVGGRPGDFTSGRTSARVGSIGTNVNNGPQIDVLVSGRGGVPRADVGAVVLNVTVTQPSTSGFLTVFPLDTQRPTASNVNYTKGRSVPNLVVAKLGRGGGISVYSSSPKAEIVIDVLGYFPGVSTADVEGSYAALGLDDLGMPLSYDRCFAIPYRMNITGSTSTERADVQSALAQLSTATGISFVNEGNTTEVPTLPRDPFTSGGNPKPLLIAWPTAAQVADLGGGVVGVGGSSYFAAGDSVRWLPEQYLTGIAYFLRDAGLDSGFGEGNSFGQLALHELGHSVGLGHVNNDVQIMFPTLINRAGGYESGDLAGLSLLYRTQACPGSPASHGAAGLAALRSGPSAASTPDATIAERVIPSEGLRWTDVHQEGRAGDDHADDDHEGAGLDDQDGELWQGPWTRFERGS